MKQETLCNDYKARGLKNVDIPNKVIALQFAWIRRLYDNFFHEQKMIPLYLIEKSFSTSFKFRSNVLFKTNKTKFLLWWLKYLLAFCFNICSKMRVSRWIKPLFIFKSFQKNISYVSQHFSDNGAIKVMRNLRKNITYMKVLILNGCN